MKKVIYNTLRKIKPIWTLCKNLKNFYFSLKYVHILNNGMGTIKKDIGKGENNTIIVGKDTFLDNTVIRIRGNNNKIVFGNNCIVGKDCSFWMEGNNISIEIGSNTTFTDTVHFCAQEDDMKIIVRKGLYVF